MPPNAIVKLKEWISPKGDRNVSRILRRRGMIAFLWKNLPSLTVTLLVLGHLWFFVIPWPGLSQRTYIDENALQPGQVHTYWNWGDVHRADQYLKELEALHVKNATSEEIASFIAIEFEKMGISASTQRYSFTTGSGSRNGTNAYAVLSSPRASGTEAMVISASWLSRTGEGDGTLNLRGVSTVLSLANFLKGYSLWAKDLVFVVSDGYLEGMQAWITAYHDASQSNLQAERLRLMSGVIWTALNIDYPGHSFSHLGVFFEGLNGRLPNQDLINSFHVISRHTGGVPMLVYDHLDPRESPTTMDELNGIPVWVPNIIKHDEVVNDYIYRARNFFRHVGYQARGRASGVHGLMHRFRIDAITLFAVPASGPHGFHAIGRIVESTLRTTNNLLERLHASFFFYLLLSPTTFLKIGSYLPSVILISTAMMFAGLREWVNAGWIWTVEHPDPGDEHNKETAASSGSGKWTRRHRPVLDALSLMISTHAAGVVLFFAISSPWFVDYKDDKLSTLELLFRTMHVLAMTIMISSKPPPPDAPLPVLLKSLNLCLASAVISIIAVLNFSLAALLAVLLGLPLFLAASEHAFFTRFAILIVHCYLGWILFSPAELRQAVWDWQVLGGWFAPFVCVVYAPLMLQAACACLLSRIRTV
ncbi:Gaa1-domain-containing protein [Sparassis latifolia]